jgi:hypothetical protein
MEFNSGFKGLIKDNHQETGREAVHYIYVTLFTNQWRVL